MDVASGPHSRHDRRSRSGGARTPATVALALFIVAGLLLLAIVAVSIIGLPPEPVSQPVRLAPLRW